MTGQIGVVSLRGLVDETRQITFLLAAGITTDQVGQAVTLDTSGTNQVKLAGDNDIILGRLETVEVRTAEGIIVGTVSLGVAMDFNVNPDATASPDETPNAVGDYIVGATTNASVKGYVQKSASNAVTPWRVVEVISSTRVVAIKL